MQGGGAGSHNEAIVYDVELTLGMPRDVTGGTALNALAHACEALYVVGGIRAQIRSRSKGRMRSLESCRAYSTISVTAPPARRCSEAPLRPARLLAGPVSRLPTRWRRRSAAATDCRTGR